MENDDKSKLDLTRLVAVLEKALDTTTRTKTLLDSSCDGAQHLLSNWHIPDASVQEEMPHCTCDNNEDSKITEVAKNIEQVVGQAQKLRETLSFPRPQSKISPLTKRSNIERISPQLGVRMKHIPQVTSNNNNVGSKKLNDKVQKKPESAKFNSVIKSLTTNNGSSTIMKASVHNIPVAKRSSADHRSPRTTLTNAKRRSIPVVNGNYDKKTITKPRLKSSSSLQTTYQKDFSVRTNTARHNSPISYSIKPKESLVKDNNTAILRSKNTISSKVRNVEREANKSNSPFLEKIGISDLEDLLRQVTIYPNLSVNSDIKKLKMPQVNPCLLHFDKRAHTIKNAYRIVELAEAVDVLGLPSDLVKVLKTYHCFLAENQEGKKGGSGTGKRQAAAKGFLNKLSIMNGDNWSNVTHEPLVGLFSDYMALVSEVSRVVECKFKDVNDEILAYLQEKSEYLEKKHRKWSNIDESVFVQSNAPNSNMKNEENCRHVSTDGWVMSGVWNSKSRQRFKALGEMQCIRYSSVVQWKKFEANVQEIQRMELQIEVFEVLESCILPQLFSYNPHDPTFPYLYKTVCSLCNMAMLTSPIMIKPC